MYVSEILGIIVALTQIGGYYVYYLSTKKEVKPNTTSWTIWTIGAILELFSYMYLTSDWVKNLLPLACSLSCIVLYLNILYRGKFEKISPENILMIIADLISLWLWYITESALVGNIALQVSTVISFIPLYKEVFDKDENETQPPWVIWSAAYLLDVVVVALRWEKWGDLVYPLTNFVLNFIMWLLIFIHLGKRNKENMTPDIESHLYTKKSNIAGTGLFTSKKIKKGETAFVLKGPKIFFSPINKRESMTLMNIVGVDENTYIVPFEPYIYINHHCEPNLATAEDGITFIALKDIDPNEELTFDYSISDATEWEMGCSCDSPNCRKIIKSIDKLPKNFFQKYYPHIPKYFQKVYIQKHIENNP